MRKRLIALLFVLMLFSSCGILSFLQKKEHKVEKNEHIEQEDTTASSEIVKTIVNRPSHEDLLNSADKQRKKAVSANKSSSSNAKKQDEKKNEEKGEKEIPDLAIPAKVVYPEKTDEVVIDTITVKAGEKKLFKIIIKKD